MNKKKLIQIAVVLVIATPIIFIIANAISTGFDNSEIQEERVNPKEIISFKGDFDIPPYSPGDSVEVILRHKNDKVSYKFRAFADSVYSQEAVSNFIAITQGRARSGSYEFFALHFNDEDEFSLGSKKIYTNDVARKLDTLGNVLEFRAEGTLDMSYNTFQQIDTVYTSSYTYDR